MNDRLNKLTQDETYQFFEALLSKCKQENVYSVIETAEHMGVSYGEVKEWASSNEDWKYYQEMCRSSCACHAQKDALIFK